MSEYQYYEFRALDRPLNNQEMEELRALSTRAEITPTSFSNVYHFGSFRGNPKAMVDKYFDIFVYVANWGSNQLMIRIPRRFLDVEIASRYADDEALTIRPSQDHIVLDFRLQDEEPPEDWVEGEAWMPALVSIRTDLMRGDYRAIYLGWLAGIPMREDEGDEEEPPVPPGLAKLSAPLQALADFLAIDEDLIEVAARGSLGEPPAAPTREALARWVKRLPAADKDGVLLRFLSDEGELVLRAELLQRFRESTAPKSRPKTEARRRTIGELLSARDVLDEEKRRAKAEQRAREKAEKSRREAELRGKRLDDLSRRQPETWKSVEELIGRKVATSYDEAISLLLDLRDLARRSGTEAAFNDRVRELRERHRNKPSFRTRLDGKVL